MTYFEFILTSVYLSSPYELKVGHVTLELGTSEVSEYNMSPIGVKGCKSFSKCMRDSISRSFDLLVFFLILSRDYKKNRTKPIFDSNFKCWTFLWLKDCYRLSHDPVIDIITLFPIVNGAWSFWSEWSPCLTNTCSQRARLCTNPAPEVGGDVCEGLIFERKDCQGPVRCKLGFDKTYQAIMSIFPFIMECSRSNTLTALLSISPP